MGTHAYPRYPARLRPDQIIVEVVEINYGMQGKNPVDQVRRRRRVCGVGRVCSV